MNEAVGAHAHRVDAEFVEQALNDGTFARQERPDRGICAERWP